MKSKSLAQLTFKELHELSESKIPLNEEVSNGLKLVLDSIELRRKKINVRSFQMSETKSNKR